MLLDRRDVTHCGTRKLRCFFSKLLFGCPEQIKDGLKLRKKEVEKEAVKEIEEGIGIDT